MGVGIGVEMEMGFGVVFLACIRILNSLGWKEWNGNDNGNGIGPDGMEWDEMDGSMNSVGNGNTNSS